MACCLMIWSHQLNKCRLLINGILWHSPETNFTGSSQNIIKWVWKINSYNYFHISQVNEFNFYRCLVVWKYHVTPFIFLMGQKLNYHNSRVFLYHCHWSFINTQWKPYSIPVRVRVGVSFVCDLKIWSAWIT